MVVTTEFETTFSASVRVDCWADLALAEVAQIFARETVGADWLETRIRATGANPAGFVIVQQNEREAEWPPVFMATANPGHEGEIGARGDLIAVPQEDAQ
jgi:hypothetical protein